MLGFIPLVIYALGFLIFGGLSLLFIFSIRNSYDPGVALGGAFLFMIVAPTAIITAVLLLIKILHVATRFPLFGVLCTGVDLLLAVSAVRLLISYMTDSIPFGNDEITLIFLSVVFTLTFITNAALIRT